LHVRKRSTVANNEYSTCMCTTAHVQVQAVTELYLW